MDGDLDDLDVGGDLPPFLRALLVVEGVDPADVVEFAWHDDLVRGVGIVSVKLKPKTEEVEMTVLVGGDVER